MRSRLARRLSFYSTCVLIFVAVTSVGAAQGLSPKTPASEYVRLGSQVIAIEHSVSIQSQVAIDAPGSQAGLSGTQTFSGWAIDKLSSIARVEISVDGVSYGQATYGVSRTDVCNAYPGRPGCPNVGWAVTFNTAELGNGTHTLSVTVWTSESFPRQTTVERVFSTVNSSPSSQNTSQIQIDAPSWNSTFSGPTQFSGWAIDSSSVIASINVAIDGISWGPAQSGLSRPDVCNVYPGRPGCPNVGWAFQLDTSLLADGSHNLTITAITSDSVPRVSTAVIPFETDNSYSSAVTIDAPTAQNSYAGVQQFSGWAVNRNATIGIVSVAVDGLSFGNASSNLSRPDVCNSLGNLPGCPNVGWSFSLNTASLTNGQHTLTVTAFTNEEYYVETTLTRVFTTNNPNPAIANKSQVQVDAPGPNNIYSGQQMFSGWAIDNTSALSSVNVTIDGVSYAAKYGGARPDVCNAYPGRAGCPNVGWSFGIDTATLADGLHTLTVTAMTADSPPRPTTATVLFTSSNSQLSWLFPQQIRPNQNTEQWRVLGE